MSKYLTKKEKADYMKTILDDEELNLLRLQARKNVNALKKRMPRKSVFTELQGLLVMEFEKRGKNES